ncbi:MAG: hypothetical protein R2784_17395 [Saprospiraceae bacterium]
MTSFSMFPKTSFKDCKAVMQADAMYVAANAAGSDYGKIFFGKKSEKKRIVAGVMKGSKENLKIIASIIAKGQFKKVYRQNLSHGAWLKRMLMWKKETKPVMLPSTSFKKFQHAISNNNLDCFDDNYRILSVGSLGAQLFSSFILFLNFILSF